MNAISFEVSKLLERLYNLRSEDSVVLKEINKTEKELILKQEKDLETKEILESEIVEYQKTIDTLSSESEKLYALLSNIKINEYKTIIEMLKFNFDPVSMREEFEEKYPQLIEKYNNELSEKQDELKDIKAQLDDISIQIEELSLNRDEAIKDQEKLNEYFLLSLNGNDNLTRESINNLLNKFSFSDEEKKLASKILMFPEDALYDYDKKVKAEENKGISISDVLIEAKENGEVVEEEIEEEKPIINDDYEINPIFFNNEQEEEKEEEPRVEENDKDIKEYLETIGLEPLDFNVEKIEKITNNFDEQLIKKNVEFVKENNIDLDLFVENEELLYDSELINKIVCLLDLGKTPFDIYLSPIALTKYDYRGLKNAISLLTTSGLDPKQVPLMAF